MIAVDTSVVVRVIVKDDDKQAARARRLLETRSVLLPVSVVLESEWVLRAAYRLDRQVIAAALRGFCGLDNVTVSEPEVIAAALDLYEQGLDLADAIHLCLSRAADGFATFDRKLARLGTKHNLIPPIKEP
ncbi:MAG TPA: type II toxin-antitoxin system VapC family toxin [Hyphomicrobiaceae bacterium]|nr:type II toxin-antitoxin system VapC family toxin [Hyphomicrobiaceae bacterium]